MPVTIHTTKVWVDEHVRELLRKDWSDTNPDQVERKYCISYSAELDMLGDSVFTVHGIVPALVTKATPGSVRGMCPPDIAGFMGIPLFTHFTDVHTHAPTTCEHSQEQPYYNCKLGGLEAWECFPSAADWAYLIGSGYRFAFVQCSKEALVPYFMTPYWRS